MTETTSDASPYNGLRSRWKVTEDGPDGRLEIRTEDGKLRIFRMFHSGFGVSTTDRKIAAHVVNFHNALLDAGITTGEKDQ
jgi:hypothetical protein